MMPLVAPNVPLAPTVPSVMLPLDEYLTTLLILLLSAANVGVELFPVSVTSPAARTPSADALIVPLPLSVTPEPLSSRTVAAPTEIGWVIEIDAASTSTFPPLVVIPLMLPTVPIVSGLLLLVYETELPAPLTAIATVFTALFWFMLTLPPELIPSVLPMMIPPV